MASETRTGQSGIIFNTQHFTIHDGPGIRTTVFLKGCPLRCPWCSNPEGLDANPQVGVYPDRCIGVSKCGFCLKACPEAAKGAIKVEEDKVVGIDRGVCTHCLRCVDACPASNALKAWGRRMSVEEAMAIVRADRAFYEKSGGGLTLSGGEVFIQHAFAANLLKACRAEGIHACVESTLHCSRRVLEEVLGEADFLITDIKHIDPVRHKELTGVSNETILSNMKRAVEMGLPTIVRIPVVAGYNNDEENIRGTARFIAESLGNAVLQVQLLPFRQLGTDKYEALGMAYPMADYEVPPREAWEPNLRHLAEVMKEYGNPAVAGTSVKYSGEQSAAGSVNDA